MEVHAAARVFMVFYTKKWVRVLKKKESLFLKLFARKFISYWSFAHGYLVKKVSLDFEKRRERVTVFEQTVFLLKEKFSNLTIGKRQRVRSCRRLRTTWLFMAFSYADVLQGCELALLPATSLAQNLLIVCSPCTACAVVLVCLSDVVVRSDFPPVREDCKLYFHKTHRKLLRSIVAYSFPALCWKKEKTQPETGLQLDYCCLIVWSTCEFVVQMIWAYRLMDPCAYFHARCHSWCFWVLVFRCLFCVCHFILSPFLGDCDNSVARACRGKKMCRIFLFQLRGLRWGLLTA